MNTIFNDGFLNGLPYLQVAFKLITQRIRTALAITPSPRPWPAPKSARRLRKLGEFSRNWIPTSSTSNLFYQRNIVFWIVWNWFFLNKLMYNISKYFWKIKLRKCFSFIFGHWFCYPWKQLLSQWMVKIRPGERFNQTTLSWIAHSG